jgi:hypothetical protein
VKAIITKYHGPGNIRGARISAFDCDNRIYISYPHELDSEAAHRAAAQALCDKLKWPWTFVTGGLKNGYVHVFVN